MQELEAMPRLVSLVLDCDQRRNHRLRSEAVSSVLGDGKALIGCPLLVSRVTPLEFESEKFESEKFPPWHTPHSARMINR